jgi:hypothetical protein
VVGCNSQNNIENLFKFHNFSMHKYTLFEEGDREDVRTLHVGHLREWSSILMNHA